MNSKLRSILLVDDEQHILTSYSRGLRKSFNVISANSPQQALDLLSKHKSTIPVIVSDFNMPEMNGDAFLKKTLSLSPSSVRILLSGKAEISDVLTCVNECKIFRFLLKPFSLQDMTIALNDAIKQYDLQQAEKVLLGQTLIGTVQICVDFLTIHSPLVFSYVSKLKKQIEFLCHKLSLPHQWRYSIAALLSHHGGLLLDTETLSALVQKESLNNEDRVFYQEMIKLSAQMIQAIPKLELTANIILEHTKPLSEFKIQATTPIKQCSGLVIGCQLLSITIQLNRFLKQGHSLEHITSEMLNHPDAFHPEIVTALLDMPLTVEGIKAKIKIEDLTDKMIIADDIVDRQNHLIIPAAQKLNALYIAKLKILARQKKIEPWAEVYIS